MISIVEFHQKFATNMKATIFRCLAGQMERECINAIRNYQNEKLKPIEDEIKNLIGIEIGNGAEN